MKRLFKILIKQIALILSFVNICLISYGQSKVEGVYVNQVNATSTFKIKIKNINDTLSYYELEGREDLGFENATLEEIMNEIANPILFGKLSEEKVLEMRMRLQ